jgi:hypothetical protein
MGRRPAASRRPFIKPNDIRHFAGALLASSVLAVLWIDVKGRCAGERLMIKRREGRVVSEGVEREEVAGFGPGRNRAPTLGQPGGSRCWEGPPWSSDERREGGMSFPRFARQLSYVTVVAASTSRSFSSGIL